MAYNPLPYSQLVEHSIEAKKTLGEARIALIWRTADLVKTEHVNFSMKMRLTVTILTPQGTDDIPVYMLDIIVGFECPFVFNWSVWQAYFGPKLAAVWVHR